VLGTVFDITPNLLYLLDVPLGRDMRYAKIMKEVISEEQLNKRPPDYVETHDIDFRPPTSSMSSGDSDKAFSRRFKELGYF